MSRHKKSNTSWLWIAGAGLGLFFASRKGFAMSGKTYGAPLKLSKNFDLLEFLRQHKGLESYKLNQQQFDAVSALATKVLQPARDAFGPLGINSGCRPPEWRDSNGKSLDDLLKAQGYFPSPNSDHDFCGAADLKPDDVTKAMPLAIFLANLPDTRQVILEYKSGPNGTRVFSTVHVAVVTPGRPKMLGNAYAFVKVDDKHAEQINWQKPLV